MNKKKIKKNNKGFSLIELIIAMAIFVIAAVPLLHSFISTANANSKAKKQLSATAIAQDIVEGVKAQTLEEISEQFNYRTTKGFRVYAPTAVGSVGEMLYDEAQGKYVSALQFEGLDDTAKMSPNAKNLVTASTYSTDGGNTTEFIQRDNGKYYFAMGGVKQGTAEYDVLVELDASDYKSGGSGSMYNEDKLLTMPIVNLDCDAMCIQSEEYTENAKASIGVDSRDDLKRVITIKVENKRDITNKYKTVVTAKYVYTDPLNSSNKYEKTETVYESAGTFDNENETDLRNVFLYYFPLYTGDYCNDMVLIYNESKLDVDFYIVKQQLDSAMYRATREQERDYRMTISVKEGMSYYNNMVTDVYSNADINLVVLDEYIRAGASYPVDSDADFYISGVHVCSNRILTSDTRTTNDERIEEWKNAGCWYSMLNRDKTDRFFDLKVNVYNKGAAAEGFPASELITSIEGYKVQ